MRASIKRIIFLLFTIIFLPVVFYAGFELSSLNKNEEVLNEIYNKQLDAILFSINQYSNDIISSLATNIEMLDARNASDSLFRRQVFFEFPSIALIDLKPLNGEERKIYNYRNFYEAQNLLDSLHLANEKMIKRLRSYIRNDYQKLEPIQQFIEDGVALNGLICMIDPGKNGDYKVCTIIFQADQFINDFLAPQMNKIAENEFIISAIRKNNQSVVYSTEATNADINQSKELWLLPEYSLGITLKGSSIRSIIKERTRMTVILISGLLIILLLGFWLIIRNVKREVQLAQTKADFVSNVSHEIRTPLSLISMFAETLLMNRVPSEARKMQYYDIISKETTRLRNIVNKILNFSQIEANKKKYHFEAACLNEMVKDVINTYSFHLQNKNFTYEIKLHEALPNVKIDREAIVESIINLIDNAIKYSPEEKHLTVATGIKNRMIFVEVKDRGVGIDEKKKKHIFDKFYRITKGDVYYTQGAGLGLSIVKNIMDAHNGRIEVESKIKKGSTFRLLFPNSQTQQL